MRMNTVVLSIALLCGGTTRGVSQEPFTVRPRDRTPLATRTPEECAGVVAPADLKNPPADYRAAECFIAMLPGKVPKELRGKPIGVRYLQTARGTLDSIQVEGIDDAKYRARFIKNIESFFAEGDFRPAVYQGCALDSWYSYTMTAGPR